jgi:hypothetical protein
MKTITARLFVMVFFGLSGANVIAAPVTWTIDALAFDDGGSGSGSFTYDSHTNTYTGITIVTTSGSVLTGSVYSFLNPSPLSASSHTGLALVSSDAADLTGLPGLGLGFAEVLTNAGGTVLLTAGTEGTCLNFNCGSPDNTPTRSILSGRISAIPVPAAVWLFASGLGLLGWLRR